MQYQEIKPYIDAGLVSEQKHPDHPNYVIFNYTQKCQFEAVWHHVTMNCRGLILDVFNDKIVARPFPKFFNYGEHIGKNMPIPDEEPQVLEKMDGSLGILYWLHGRPWIATRGSFTSDQAKWATDYFRKNYPDFLPQEGITHLFEIIYPQNRIVVNYDFSGLVHLATLNNETGLPIHYDWDFPIRKIRRFPSKPLEELAKLDMPNEEGFVIYFPKANMRMKIKFPEYVRLHKLITGVSEIAIWEHLSQGNGLDDLLEKVPDEFFKWVEGVQNRLRADFAKIWGEAQMAVQMVQGKPSRKEQALWIMDNAKPVSGVVFSLLDGEEKKAAQQVWKMLRPHGQSAFKVDIDS